jgi:hypothetical protein
MGAEMGLSIVQDDDKLGKWSFISIVCKDSPEYAEFGKRSISAKEQEANALLIASAPELLEALIQMVANAEADGKVYRDCYKKAVAALAKAEGRSAPSDKKDPT